VFIDPVMLAWQRRLHAVNQLGQRIVMTIDPHIHAD